MSICNLEQCLPRSLDQAEMREAIVTHLVSLLYACDARDVMLDDALAEAERRYLEIIEGGTNDAPSG